MIGILLICVYMWTGMDTVPSFNALKKMSITFFLKWEKLFLVLSDLFERKPLA